MAINVPGVEIDQVRRGDVLITPDSLPVTRRLDARLTLLKSADRPLKNRARVRFHLGAAEIMARVVLLELDELTPGNSAYAQIQLEGETVAAYGDTFVIRSYSPTCTIGGGKICSRVPAPQAFSAGGHCHAEDPGTRHAIPVGGRTPGRGLGISCLLKEMAQVMGMAL